MDGTLIEAAASPGVSGPRMNRRRPPRTTIRATRQWTSGGERRRNETHASTTDPDAPAAQGAGKEAKMAFLGHALMENRHGGAGCGAGAPGRGAGTGLPPAHAGGRPRLRHQGLCKDIRSRRVTPHVARKKHSAIDGRTTRHAGYAVNLRIRERVEEVFGWMKTMGGLRRTRYRGRDRTGLAGYLVATAYNLVRMADLTAEPEWP